MKITMCVCVYVCDVYVYIYLIINKEVKFFSTFHVFNKKIFSSLYY